jgi:hypothetical protein
MGVCWRWVTGWVIHQCCQCPIQWFVERLTKSAKLVKGALVTLSTSLFGREPASVDTETAATMAGSVDGSKPRAISRQLDEG